MTAPGCLVCGGTGFVQAAPVQVVAEWTGANPTPEHSSRAAWEHAVAVPCFACTTTPIGRPN